MARSDLDEAVDQLYAVPLEAFVAERKRLAKELRTGGDRPAAAELAKLPKPSAAAWALNHVARERPDAVGDWLEAADALREASTHAADVGGDAIRRAMADHRTATTRLTGVVRERAQPSGRPLSEAMLDRVRALLQAATADARVAERLRAGQITEEAAPDEEGPDEAGLGVAGPDEAGADVAEPDEVAPETAAPEGVASGEAAPRAAPGEAEPAAAPAEPEAAPAEPEPPARPRRDRGAELRAKRRAELDRRVSETSDELERLLERAAERVEAAESADERVEEARRALHRSESEAAAARAAADEAADAAAATERDLQQLRARLRRASD